MTTTCDRPDGCTCMERYGYRDGNCTWKRNDDPRADRAQQNAREVGPAVVQLLYRLMRDHGISPDELRAHVAECRNEEACYTDAALGVVAVQAAQSLLPAPVAAERPGAWDGPFTAGKCQVHNDAPGVYDGAAVFDATGEPFALVADDNCVGGNLGARARATRIAECLNRDQHLFERQLVGNQMIPEPTEAMIAAGRSAWQSAIKDRNLDKWLVHIYHAMEAAREPEAERTLVGDAEEELRKLVDAARMYEAACRLGGKDQDLASRALRKAKGVVRERIADRLPTITEPEAGKLREALEEQTLLVDRLCSAVDQASEDIGHESIDDLLKLVGPLNEQCIELLGGRTALIP